MRGLSSGTYRLPVLSKTRSFHIESIQSPPFAGSAKKSPALVETYTRPSPTAIPNGWPGAGADAKTETLSLPACAAEADATVGPTAMSPPIAATLRTLNRMPSWLLIAGLLAPGEVGWPRFRYQHDERPPRESTGVARFPGPSFRNAALPCGAETSPPGGGRTLR